MTRNQIDWQNMLISGKRQSEDARHNLATEFETKRSNLAREYLTGDEIRVKRDNLEEAMRHNKVSEWLDDFRNQEAKRHNQVDEARDMLNVSLQHLDRAEANRVNDSFNQLTAATRELERVDKKANMEANVSISYDKVLKDYRIALKNWENNAARLKLDQEMLPYSKWATGTQAFGNVARGIKDVAGLFTVFGGLK